MEITVDNLVALYKREIPTEPDNFRLQTMFDDYVSNFTPENPESGISDEELRECAHNFIEYDL